jgi:hypothetical protein
MGAVNSKKLDVTTIANTVSTAAVSQLNVCASSQGVKQDLNVKNVGGRVVIGDVSQDATISIRTECLQDAKFQQDVKSSMTASLTEEIKQANSGLIIGSTQNISETQSKAIENVITSIDLNQLQSCLSQAMVEQNQSYENIGGFMEIKSISQKVAIDTTTKCIANQAGFQKASTELISTVKSKTDQTNEGLNIVASILACACLALIVASIIFQILKAPATLGKSAAQGAASLASIPATVASSSISGSSTSEGGQSNDMWKYALVLVSCLCSSSSAGAGVYQMQQKKT